MYKNAKSIERGLFVGAITLLYVRGFGSAVQSEQRTFSAPTMRLFIYLYSL